MFILRPSLGNKLPSLFMYFGTLRLGDFIFFVLLLTLCISSPQSCLKCTNVRTSVHMKYVGCVRLCFVFEKCMYHKV